MERLGVDYASCRKIKPEYLLLGVGLRARRCVRPIGSVRPDRAGRERVRFHEWLRRPEGVPRVVAVMDISTAMMACNAILGALSHVNAAGSGRAIRVSLFDNAVLMTGYAPLQASLQRRGPSAHGNTSPDTCPVGVFQAQDRSFYINCGNDKIFQRLMSQVIDPPGAGVAATYGPDRTEFGSATELFGILGKLRKAALGALAVRRCVRRACRRASAAPSARPFALRKRRA